MQDKKELQEIKDLLEQTLISTRESVTPSFSKMMHGIKTEIREDLKRMEQKLDAHVAKSEPVLKAMDTINSVQTVMMWLTTKLIVPLAILFGAVYAVKEWIKK